MVSKVSPGATIGITGLSLWKGVLGEEYLSALKGTKKAKVFREMQDDAVISTLLDSIQMPLVAAEFETVPAGETEQDKVNAEFLKQCISDMTNYSWRQHVLDMLTMLVWGWSVSEFVFKKRLGNNGQHPSQYNDGRIGLHILDPRGQETLDHWIMNDQEFVPEALVQKDPNSGRLIEIPAWKLLHSTFRSRKRSPEGTSPMNSLYKSWYTRKNLEVLEAIGAERDLAGLPVIYLPYGATDADKAAAETLIRNIRQDEEAGLVIPAPTSPESKHKESGWLFELIGSPGSKQFNVRQIVQDLNKTILMRFFAQFLMLGMEQVGTQALVEGSQDFFSMCLKSVQMELLETWNQQLVPLLFTMNPGLLQGATAYPKLDWAQPGSKDVAKIVQAVQGMVSAGLLTAEPNLEDYMRAITGLPDRPEGVGEGDRTPPQAANPFGFAEYDWKKQPDGSYVVKKKFEADLGGAMLAIAVPEAIASQIAVPGGEPVKQLHITLAFLGESSDIEDKDKIIEVVSKSVSGLQPLVVALQGTGTFPEKDGETPFYAKVVSPELMALRKKIVTALDEAGIDYSKDYAFSPHVTLKYLTAGEEPFDSYVNYKFTVDRVHVVFGDVWTAVPMAVSKDLKRSVFADVSGIRGRRADSKIGQKTNEYQKLLTALYDAWAEKAHAAILAASQGNRRGLVKEVDKQLQVFAKAMKEAAGKHLAEAFRLGYKKELDKAALKLVAEKVETNNAFVDDSLIPRIREKIISQLGALEAEHKYQIDEIALFGLLESLRAEPSGYAGAFWNTVFLGAGYGNQQIDQARVEAGLKVRRVRWVLDPAAEHCKKSEFHYGCPDLAGEYESWNSLPTVPAGDCSCLGRCRCSLEVENDHGGWDRVA